MSSPTNDSPASVEEIFAEFEPYKGKDYGSMTEYRITKFRLAEATARINQLLTEARKDGAITELERWRKSCDMNGLFDSSLAKDIDRRITALKDGQA